MSSISALHRLAIAALNKGQFSQAHQYCVSILQQQPNHADAYFLLAMLNMSIGQNFKAIELCKHAIAIQNNVEYRVYLCQAYALVGQTDAVVSIAATIDPQKLHDAKEFDTLGVALSQVGLHSEALEYFANAIKLKSDAKFYYNYAVSSKFCGHFKQAKKAFEKALLLKVDYYQAHFALADLTNIDESKAHAKVLIDKLTDHSLTIEARLHLSHALAKEYEKSRQYLEAFEVLNAAKKSKLKLSPYDASHTNAVFEHLHSRLSTTRDEKAGHPSTRPVFVVGMPRSGTTLVERILSCHSDVEAAGELQDFGMSIKSLTKTPSPLVLDLETLMRADDISPKAIADDYLARTAHIGKGAQHFVDKLPFNFFYIPTIRRAFPNARIICLLREPMDTCVGNYRQLFTIHNPFYSYTYDLLACGQFYRQFHQWVSAWQQTADPNFLMVDYQALTADPESQIRTLLAFCGLPWQEQCLYIENNNSPTSTASKMQVREPINRQSINRWKKYHPYTEGLEEYFRGFL